MRLGNIAFSCVFCLLPLLAMADQVPPDRSDAIPNPQVDPYRALANFLKLPPGRTMGSTSAVGVDSKGHIWVVDRCQANSCAGSNLDPIMEFDAAGNFLKAFGRGKILFAHGFTIDKHDHLWITDGHVAPGKGDDVLEFDSAGKLVRVLGTPGVPGDGPDSFNEPNAVLIAPNGDIFVSDGHTPHKGNSRIVKFDPNGKFLMQWGEHGSGPGQLEVPHCLAMDAEGRLYVGDRDNNRIQIFTQNGKLLGQLTQFGRPSGIFIDKNDVLYVSDSESREAEGYGHHHGWKRGIRIGSLKNGIVSAFIPDTDPNQNSGTSGGEGIFVDSHGRIYSAQVGQKAIVKYVKM